MHLVSSCDQTVRVSGRSFRFARGETIHTENSHKYTLESFAEHRRARRLVRPPKLGEPEARIRRAAAGVNGSPFMPADGQARRARKSGAAII